MLALVSLCITHFQLNINHKCKNVIFQTLSFNITSSLWIELLFYSVLLVQSIFAEMIYRYIIPYILFRYFHLSMMFNILTTSIIEACHHLFKYYFSIRDNGQYFLVQYFCLHFFQNVILTSLLFSTNSIWCCIIVHYSFSCYVYYDLLRYKNQLDAQESIPKRDLPEPLIRLHEETSLSSYILEENEVEEDEEEDEEPVRIRNHSST